VRGIKTLLHYRKDVESSGFRKNNTCSAFRLIVPVSYFTFFFPLVVV